MCKVVIFHGLCLQTARAAVRLCINYIFACLEYDVNLLR